MAQDADVAAAPYPATADTAAAPPRRRFHKCRGGCGLGRLVRRLRRQTRCLRSSAARPTSAGRCQQYDPLSYARNFDMNGFGSGVDGDEEPGHFSYTFSSRFVGVAGLRSSVLASGDGGE